MMKNCKKSLLMVLTGSLILSGFSVGVPGNRILMGNDLSIVHAADGNTYNTQGGIATMGKGTAGIVISGNDGQSLIGKQFHVYKLFDAENAKGGESINYTFNPAYAQALKNVVAAEMTEAGTQTTPDQVTEYMVIDYIQTLNTNPVEGARTEQTLEGRYSAFRYFVEAVRDELVKLKAKPDVVNVKNVRSDQSVRLEGLDYGYYIIDEVTQVDGSYAAGSLCMVDTANPTASVSVKSDYPKVEKKIQEDDSSQQIMDPDGWNDIADYEIGQTVPYKYTSNIPNMNGYDTYYYAWHDKMDPSLTFHPQTVQIRITGELNGKTKTYTLKESEFQVEEKATEGETFRVVVKDIKAIVDREFDQMNDLKENIYGQSVLLTYEATLNESAAGHTGRPGFENDVRLEFSNDADHDHTGSTGFTPWDTVVCFTYQVNVLKTNNHARPLEDAKFRLYSDKECQNEVYVKEGNGGYVVLNRDLNGGTDHIGGTVPKDAVEMSSNQQGTFTIYGLDGGTYYLKETDAPDGYRPLLDPITIQVTPTFTDARDQYVKGQGATEHTLQKLEATAHIESFWDGLLHKEDQNLETNVEKGSANLTVINQVGMKLPITGTHTTLLLISVGVGLMAVAMVQSKRKQEKE